MEAQNIFWEKFDEKFKNIKDRNIVLYGIGEKTETVIKNALSYNIIGIMDQNCVGMNIYGKKVLSIREASEKAEVIIIVANLQSCPIIFARIKELADEGISIYYINGVQASIDDGNTKQSENKICYNNLYGIIDKNEIISFDIFDTLVMRKTMLTTDIFELVEKSVNEKFPNLKDFKKIRILAEKKCYENGKKIFSIDDIYNEIQIYTKLEHSKIEYIKQIELKIELKLCVSRKDVVKLYEYAKKSNKKILLVSDMYLKKEQIIEILKINKIDNFDDIYISCEMNKSKVDGTMWSWISQKYFEKNILHFGDNQISDYEQVKKYGFEAVLINSALEIFRNSKYSKLEKYAQESFENRCILGMLINELFNSPFEHDKNSHDLNRNLESGIGRTFLGPIVLTYIVWLKKQCILKNNEIILFFARDGYLLKKAYDILNQNNSKEFPIGIYFYTSRRAASVAYIESKEDIEFVLDEFCKIKKAKIGNLIKRVFGIDIKGELSNIYYYEIDNEELKKIIIDEYLEKILLNALEERNNYINYINNLEIGRYDNLACVNFVGRGITQFCMQKLLRKKLDGFYFGTEYGMHKFYVKEDLPLGLYGNLEEPCMTESKIIGNYLVGEMFFTSPEEQLIKFNELGIPIFNQNSGRDYSYIESVHKSSLEYICEMKEIYEDIDNWEIDEKLIDEIYGIMLDFLRQFPEHMKEKLSFNDYYNPENENQKIVF